MDKRSASCCASIGSISAACLKGTRPQQGGWRKTCKLRARPKRSINSGSKDTETDFELGLNLKNYLLSQKLALLQNDLVLLARCYGKTRPS
jgi:hypothetical protein